MTQHLIQEAAFFAAEVDELLRDREQVDRTPAPEPFSSVPDDVKARMAAFREFRD